MEEIKIGRKSFEIIKPLFGDESVTESLVSFKGKNYIAREYKNDVDFKEALYRYKKIYSYGIYTPVLRYKDKKSFVLIFDHIEGESVASLLAKEDLPKEVFEKIFTFYRYARANQIELNYLPENYVLLGRKLYYTSLELYPMNKDINLENYGMEFWIMSKKGYDHLVKLGYEVDKKRILSTGEANKKIVLLSLFNW